MNRKTIEESLGLSDDELYLEIGMAMSRKGILEKSRKELIEDAKGWLKMKHQSLQSSICGSSKIKALLDGPQDKQSDVETVAAVADLIAGIMLGISPIWPAVLIVRRGLRTFCSNDSKSA